MGGGGAKKARLTMLGVLKVREFEVLEGVWLEVS